MISGGHAKDSFRCVSGKEQEGEEGEAVNFPGGKKRQRNDTLTEMLNTGE